MTLRLSDSREVGGADPLDTQVARVPGATVRRLDLLLRSRGALGLRPVAAPAIVFIPIGILLGPQVLNLLSLEVLSHLDTVVSVGLAALGVFVGLALDLRGQNERPLLIAASVEALATIAIVAGAFLVLLFAWGIPLDASLPVVALALGIAASASSAGAAEICDDPVHRLATRVADLDDLLPILAGGLLLAWLAHPDAAHVLLFAALTAAIGVLIGLAAWLLIGRAEGDAERGVFVVGTVVLLGGSAAYLGLSPLLAGMTAACLWRFAPGNADHVIRGDLEKIQHPLVVLLLVVAGAALVPSRIALWLFAPFVVFRLVGKLVGSWVGARVTGNVTHGDLCAYLLAPGVIGIAFALNFLQVSSTAAGIAVVTATAAGSLASELLALLVVPTQPEETA